ncbi:MAG TPA: nicotinamide riboside transporter PnuC [Saprospiraceae bacterium]|nr:nicotinamide riboside transporter PnuC [Saprospiraceae bacterium]
MQDILTSLLHQSTTQWIALITGLIYVVLAAYEKPLCWPFGIISCSVIAADDFAVFQLYADGVLQIFYVLFGFLGLYYWLFRNEPGRSLHVSSWQWKKHLIPIVVGVLASIPISIVLQRYTNAAYSYLDTLTTLLSLWATWLLVRKVLENWLYWIAIDSVYVILFWTRGGGLIAVLYAVYLLVAIWGYVQWKKHKEHRA